MNAEKKMFNTVPAELYAFYTKFLLENGINKKTVIDMKLINDGQLMSYDFSLLLLLRQFFHRLTFVTTNGLLICLRYRYRFLG